MPRPLMVYLVILTSLGWAVNLGVELFDKGSGDPAVNGIFAIVVGALFAFGRKASGSAKDLQKRVRDALKPPGEDDRE